MTWPGASAELVETYISSPIEAVIQAVRGVRKISSESSEGFSYLTVDLEEQANVQLVRLGILERLELLRTELPAGAYGLSVSNYVPEGLDEEPLLRFTVYGPYTAGALQDIVERLVTPRLSAVPGVAGIQNQGGAQIGVGVSYDPERLRQLGIQPDALAEALARARVVEAVGEEGFGATQRPVVLRDVPDAVENLADLPVSGPGGRVHRLGDLADIRREEDSRDQFFRVDGEPAVMLSVARLPGADAIRTAALVRKALDETVPKLPNGVRFKAIADESRELARQLNDLAVRGGIAFGAVLLVLLVALRNLKAVGLVLGSAALAIAGTALGLYLLDIPANLLTLAGLGMGIGILVQDGVVVVDRLRIAADTAEARADAAARITPAILGSTLTTVVVLFPFLYLQGNTRAAFVPFAVAFAMALGCSILAAVVVIPALGAGHGMARSRWPGLKRAYSLVVVRLLRRRWATLGVTVVALAILGWGFVARVPKTSFGSWWGQRTTLSANLAFPQGSDPASLDRAMRDLESIVVSRPGVEQVFAQGGRDGAFLTVVFDDVAALGPLPYQLQDELTQRAVLIGGASVGVQGRGPGFYSGGSVGGNQSFRIKVLGYSYAGVQHLAEDLQRRLQRIPRVKSVDINTGGFWFGQERAKEVSVAPDRPALARYGITGKGFADAVSREVGGDLSGQRIEIGGREMTLTLKTVNARFHSLDQLREALVPNQSGAPVRLADLATIGEGEGLSRISREDQQYVRIVSYDFRGPAKLANRTHEAFMRSIAAPSGYTVADDQFGWEKDESGQGLWLVFALGTALVILTVAMVFNSVWGAGMVFLSLPLALGGVTAAFWISGASFTREAAVGVILVIGLAVHQSILLVDAALARRGGTDARTDGRSGVRRGASVPSPSVCPSVRLSLYASRDRVGMITLVTLTTLASLLPLAVGTRPDELFGAIALATVGGTIAGTIGALFIVPVLLVGRRRT